MRKNVKLVKGQVYDYRLLECTGWSNGQYDYGGICHREYFEDVADPSCGTGRYRGPDEHGVEPLYLSETAADLCDAETNEVIRKATVAEMEQSLNCGQPEGRIDVDGRRCYVAA